MKLARLPISDVLLADLLMGKTAGDVTTDAPQDLKVHGFVPEPGQPWTLTLIVESETFPEVNSGAPLPEVMFHYTRAAAERPSA